VLCRTTQHPAADVCTAFDALSWMARSGGRWRDLPARLGSYQTVKRRYYRWVENGTLDRLFEGVSSEPDLEWLMIDATIIRAHIHIFSAIDPGTLRASARIAPWRMLTGADSTCGYPRILTACHTRPFLSKFRSNDPASSPRTSTPHRLLIVLDEVLAIDALAASSSNVQSMENASA
jgi:transposase